MAFTILYYSMACSTDFIVCTTLFMSFRKDKKKINITVILYDLILYSILRRSKSRKDVDAVTVTHIQINDAFQRLCLLSTRSVFTNLRSPM